MATVKKNIPRNLVRLLQRFTETHEQALERAGRILLSAIQQSVRKRAYKTGFLYSSVELRVKKFVSFTTFEVFTNCFYAGFVERGTIYIKPRRMFALGLIEAKARINREFDLGYRQWIGSLKN